MRWRVAVLLVVWPGLLAGRVALAQTTTSTSSVPTSTTSTSPPNRCAGQPCSEDPPVAFLSASTGEVRLDPLGFCWTSPTVSAQGISSARCTAAPLGAPAPTLVVGPGETLTLRFAIGMSPTAASLELSGRSTPLTAANPLTFRADLPAGTTSVDVATRWLQGDVSYRVTLDARAATPPPATPRPGVVRLTG